jgi:Ca2+-binding RTX toxin-like protein
VLQAGGSGDTIDGGSAGGCYFLAGSGNETLNGGNTAGTALFFLGSGRDLVNLGSGNSIVDTGTGQATVVGTGSGDVYGGTGGADLFTAVGGNTSVHGFRIGLDHVSGAGGAVVQGANTVVTLSNGGRIELLGVTTTAHLFG